jgi:hypothetical protein
MYFENDSVMDELTKLECIVIQVSYDSESVGADGDDSSEEFSSIDDIIHHCFHIR